MIADALLVLAMLMLLVSLFALVLASLELD
jgi:hypothetical protein